MLKEPKLTKKQREEAERADLLEKEPTQLHYEMAAWLVETTGYQPPDWEEFVKSIQLTRVLLTVFQKSDINQRRLQASAEARERAEQERAAKVKGNGAATDSGNAKGGTRKGGKGATTAQAETEAPKRGRGRGTKGATTTTAEPATSGTTRRRGGRRTAAAAAATSDAGEVINENPF